MSRSLRCAVLALATFVCADAAFSLPLAEYDARRGDTLDLYVSGASAQDNALERLFRLQCEPNSLDIFRAGGNQRVLFCRIRSGNDGVPGFPPRQKVAFHKTSVGGSGNGVGPVIQRSRLRFINMADLKANAAQRCPPERRRVVPAEPPFDGYTEHACSNPRASIQIPDAGLSDVEPRIFAQNFGFTDEQLRTLVVRSQNAFIFGVPVTLGLRNALQASQFPPDSPCHPTNERYGDASETEACMPGLTRPQLAGVYAGTISDWRQIVNRQGYPLASQNATTGDIEAPPTVQPPTDTRVHVCRRVATSGTQASYEMFFLNQRCAVDVHPFVKAGPTVALGTGTSDVKFCLNDRNDKGLWAVGLFSTENVPDLQQNRWRFIKMDGVAPTLLNTFSGRWPFFVEQTIQWRGANSEQPLTGSKLRLIQHIAEQAGNPRVIRALNQGFRHTWGDGGVMALNTNGYRPPAPTPGKPVDEAMVRQTPVLALTHASLGTPNNCNPPLAVFPTAAP